MRPVCRNCEYFDCEGKNPTSLEPDHQGDCLNRNAPGLQTNAESYCSHFYPDSIRWPDYKPRDEKGLIGWK